VDGKFDGSGELKTTLAGGGCTVHTGVFSRGQAQGDGVVTYEGGGVVDAEAGGETGELRSSVTGAFKSGGLSEGTVNYQVGGAVVTLICLFCSVLLPLCAFKSGGLKRR
jgi:hypothetical protein